MTEVSYQVLIDLPRAEAWGRLRDLSLAHHYVPGIVDTQITTDIKAGVGASRRVYQSSSRYLEETVTHWDEGSGFTIRLHKGERDAPFKNAFFRYELKDAGSGKTRLIASMGYTPPLGGLGSVLDKLLLKRIVSGAIRDVVISMKHYYESGRPTGKNDLKELRRNTA